MQLAVVILLVVVSSIAGDVLVTRGMKEVGEIDQWSPLALIRTAWQRLRNGWVILGVACMAVAFFSYLYALGLDEVSLIVPLTGTGYILETLAAKYWLHEKVSRRRWLGTVFVMAGVLVISLAEAKEFPQFSLSLEWVRGLLLWGAAFFTLSGSAYYVIVVAAAFHFRHTAQAGEPRSLPGVSILKPVRGLNPASRSALESFCFQDYPDYEVLFGVQDPTDPVVPLLQQQAQDHPVTKIRMVIGFDGDEPNRKVTNLKQLYRESSKEIVVLSDGDIRVQPDYLRKVMSSFDDPAVGMVTCPYRNVEPGSFIARLDALGGAADLFPGILVARIVQGVFFGLGSTIAVRRRCLKEIGEFEEIEEYLGDDFRVGHLVAQTEWKTSLSAHVVEHVLGPEEVSDVMNRLVRSARGTRVCRPLGYLGLPLTYGTLFSVPLLALAPSAPWAWWLAGACWFTRYVSAFVVGGMVLKDRTVYSQWWLLPLRDLLTVVIWAAGLFGKRILWQGRRYQLTRDGRLVPVG